MITVKDHKQTHLFDPWRFLSPKRRKMLEEGWPGLFRNEILSELPIDRLKPFFSSHTGRPSKELHTVLGVCLLQQSLDLCDEDAVEQLAFNIQWHYALNITEESDSAKYICTKTLWVMRQLLIATRTDQIVFEAVRDKLAAVFSVNTDWQRIDSTHIRSNMRRLGRVGIFSQTIHKFLVNLKRHHKELMETIDREIVERYLKKKSLAAFSLVKPSEADKSLKTLTRNLFDLVEQFKDQACVTSMTSYKLMVRVLNEHCNVHTDNSRPVTVKPAKEIASDSLQNPSDPDATYDGHKGQGYQVQIMETYNDCDEEEQQRLNLITHVAVEPACQSDAAALMPAIEETLEQDLAPATLLADSLYGSDANVEEAAQCGVRVIAPTMTGNRKNRIDLAAFEFDDTGRITRCPEGHRPQIVKYKQKRDRYRACFSLQHCGQCPVKDQCRSTAGKKHSYVRYGGKDYRLALRRQAEQTDAFVDTYRWRAGVEATMSAYKKLTGVDRLRVRGFKAVRYGALLKACAVNLFRAASVYKARMKACKPTGMKKDSKSLMPIVFKEQSRGIISKIAASGITQRTSAPFEMKLAA